MARRAETTGMPGSRSEWGNVQVRLDPVLRAPLNLRRERERRQDVAERILEELGFSERMWSRHFEGHDFAESTLRLAYAMTDGFVGAFSGPGQSLFATARRIASAEPLPDSERMHAFVQAVCDLGWTEEHLPSGNVGTALGRIGEIYRRNMSAHIATLFEKWQYEGRLESSGSATVS
jgi:hypothetical protein